MRIDNTPQPIKPNVAPRDTSANTTAKTATGSSDGSLASVELSNIEGLLQLIVNANEVNASLVSETRAKIQTGEFLARQAAVDTASAILNL